MAKRASDGQVKSSSCGKANRGPIVIDSARVKVESISVEQDSGWRPDDDARTAELIQTFLSGEFGFGTLTIPAVLVDKKDKPDSYMASGRDGLIRLANGKSTVRALQHIMKEHGQNVEEAEWAQGALLDVFTRGLRVDLVYFEDYDYDVMQAWYGLMHDEDCNRYRRTSVAMKLHIVRQQKARAPGGDWGAVSKVLCDIYGPSRRTTIHRWVSLAEFSSSDMSIIVIASLSVWFVHG